MSDFGKNLSWALDGGFTKQGSLTKVIPTVNTSTMKEGFLTNLTDLSVGVFLCLLFDDFRGVNEHA